MATPAMESWGIRIASSSLLWATYGDLSQKPKIK
jgi:hypothetical protein